MSRKLALLIGASEHDDDSLPKLRMPLADVDALASVLKREDIAGFDQVDLLLNQDRRTVERKVEAFLRGGRRDDLLLLYFSGHGLLSEPDNSLCLAVRDTERQFIRSTAVRSSFITELMDNTPASRQVLILDCCHGGAFSQGIKGEGGVGTPVNIMTAFEGNGRGRLVLAASDSTQFAWEGDRVLGSLDRSLYTHFLIEGIEFGKADLNGDGKISVQEWHEYARDEVEKLNSNQRPQIFTYRSEGPVFIAKVRPNSIRAVPLPPEITQALKSPLATVRLAVISDLLELWRGEHLGYAAAAKESLLLLAQDDSRRVAAASSEALATHSGDSSGTLGAVLRSSDGNQTLGTGRNKQPPSDPAAEFRAALRLGVQRVGELLRPMLGGTGRQVIIEQENGNPVVTSDPTKVISAISLKSAGEDTAAGMLRESALQTEAQTGDGIALTVVLADAIMTGLYKALDSGIRPALLKKGIMSAVERVSERLSTHSQPKDNEQLAALASSIADQEQLLGNVIAEAIRAVGADGIIMVEQTPATFTDFFLTEGEQFESGYASGEFITDTGTGECVLDDAFVLLTSRKVSNMKQLLPILEQVARSGKPLFLVASEIEGEALATLVVNKQRGTLASCAVKAPRHGHRLAAFIDDLAILTGGLAIHEETGIQLENLQLGDLGRARRVVIARASTLMFIHDSQSGRLNVLAKRGPRIGVIRVGSETESQDDKTARVARVRHALLASRAALKEGVVPGSGVALFHASREILSPSMEGTERITAEIVRQSCEAPLRQIAQNCGLDADLVVSEVVGSGDPDYGLDPSSASCGNLLEKGVVQPTALYRVALRNAASVAILISTTETLLSGDEADRVERRKVEDGHALLLRGIEQLGAAIRQTLGPAGNDVVLRTKTRGTVVTRNAKTIARNVALRDVVEDMGASMLRELGFEVQAAVGGGVKTTMVLVARMLQESVKFLASGSNPVALSRGVKKAVSRAVADLESMSSVASSESLCAVASVAAGGDSEAGQLVVDALRIAGRLGVISIEPSEGATEILSFEGMEFNRGYLSPYFITNQERLTCVLDSPYILICDTSITQLQPILPVMEKASASGYSLLIIADDVQGEALATLTVNTLRGTLRCCAVKAPGYRERRAGLLEDIAIVTGGTVLIAHEGITFESVGLEQLGRARRVVIEKEKTTIIEGFGRRDDIEKRVSRLRSDIEQEASDYERGKLQERLTKLAGGVSIIKVGDSSEAPVQDRVGQLLDALHSARAAVEEGIVTGGGVALLRSARNLLIEGASSDERAAAEIVSRACEEPFRQIVQNAGFDPEMVLKEVMASDRNTLGFDASTGKLCDLAERGIVDPTKVPSLAIQQAGKAAESFMMTSAVIAIVPTSGRSKRIREQDDNAEKEQREASL